MNDLDTACDLPTNNRLARLLIVNCLSYPQQMNPSNLTGRVLSQNVITGQVHDCVDSLALDDFVVGMHLDVIVEVWQLHCSLGPAFITPVVAVEVLARQL